MIDRYQPHVLVLPEDDANRQIANGFKLNLEFKKSNSLRILPPAGGWVKVVEAFNNDQVNDVQKYGERRIILLIDFDNHFPERLDYIKSRIPDGISERVFVLGALSDPQELKTRMARKGLEEIGKSLAQDCSENTQRIWGYEMLRHNRSELDRLILSVKPILFTVN